MPAAAAGGRTKWCTPPSHPGLLLHRFNLSILLLYGLEVCTYTHLHTAQQQHQQQEEQEEQGEKAKITCHPTQPNPTQPAHPPTHPTSEAPAVSLPFADALTKNKKVYTATYKRGDKPSVVILGSGWAGFQLARDLDKRWVEGWVGWVGE